jgi:chemotaxis protein MotB
MRANYVSLQSNYDDLATAYKAMSAGSKKESEAMLAQLQESQRKLDEKEKEVKLLMSDLERKSSDLEEKSAKLIELQSILDKKDADVQALKNKIKSALKSFEGSGLEVVVKNGKVYVSMEEKLLFESGRFSLDKKGEEALKELAKVIEADENINVMVEGHTDNVPFSAASTAQIRDNWDLSVMRATTIVKTILKYGNIEPSRLIASGRGEYVPLDTADTREARAKNRRTEIILTPKLDTLFEILE